MRCSKCDILLDDATWPVSLRKQGIHWCRTCWNAYFKERYHKQHGIIAHRPPYVPEDRPASEEQLAWATGLWEAKGSILIEDGLLTIKVVDANILLLTHFRMVVGCGKIRRMESGSFVYHASGKQADHVVKLLFSFVVTKQGTKQIATLTSLQQRMAMMPDSVEMAWVAGLFDGAGSAGSYKVKGRKAPVILVKVGSTQKDMLQRVKATIGLGGSIYESKHARRAGQKPIYYYSAAYTKALKFLELILPYSKHPEKIEKILASEQA